MWRILIVVLLVGCSSHHPNDVVVEHPDNHQPNKLWLTVALNQQDIALLESAFKPQHPLADIDPVFSNDPSWHALAKEWIEDIAFHGNEGEWQLRNVVAEGASRRYQYRLVHWDFSVEYFYFDVTESDKGVRIDDIGNHLYRYSQVELMTQLYRRILFVDDDNQLEVGNFIGVLSRYNGQEITTPEVLHRYFATKQSVQHDRLVKELLLRALMSNPNEDWMVTTDPLTSTKLLGSEYPFLTMMVCLAQANFDCRRQYAQLPTELREDVALIAETGIRTLQIDQIDAVLPFSSTLTSVNSDYYPAYWLQLQVGIAQQDHQASVATLDNLVKRFEMVVDKELLTQVYPQRGQEFIDSFQFKQWAKRRAAQEFD